jgi:hypothetical protein
VLPHSPSHNKEEKEQKNFLGFNTAAISIPSSLNIPNHPVASPVNRKKVFFYGVSEKEDSH